MGSVFSRRGAAAALAVLCAASPLVQSQDAVAGVPVELCPFDHVPELDDALLGPDDRAYLDEFREARRRYQDLTLAEFQDEYGPDRAYRLPAAASGFVRGDSNRDGSVDITDAICTLGRLFLGTGPCALSDCEDPFDADDSGTVAITDAIFTLAFLFSGGTEPPAPYPASGADPTGDALVCADGPGLGYEPLDAQYLDSILAFYPLSSTQESAFREHGFAILDSVRYDSFFHALFEIYRQDLPVYISVDAILDALHLSFERMLITLEEEVLAGELALMLSEMRQGIAALESAPGALDIAVELDDAAAWICAAESLLLGERAECARAVDEEADRLLSLVASETLVRTELFGMPVCEDFSQFRPRGHYTKSAELERYFRAMQWVQRIGMKFVQSERHAAVAFILTKLLDDTGARARWERIDGVVRLLVGQSDSLNPAGLASLAADAGMEHAAVFQDPARYRAFVQLALARGAGRQRINGQIIRRDPYEDEFTPIPPVFHVLGQRFSVDGYVFTNVVYDRVRNPDRLMPSPLDAIFVLGDRRTVPLLQDELQTYRYWPHLATLDHLVRGYPDSFWEENLYHAWLGALASLNIDTTGAAFPAVMQTPAWERRMLQSKLASWSQLRRDTILYTKPSYSYGECTYPDGWVDPYPDFYRRIARFAARAREGLRGLGLFGEPHYRYDLESYFSNLAASCEALAGIAETELRGEPLDPGQIEFIRRLITTAFGCTPALLDGWYVHMVYRGDNRDGEVFDPTIADVHADPNSTSEGTGRVLHAAAGFPNAMVISVKTECGTTAYVGPVLSYYEIVTRGFTRLTDEEWEDRLLAGDTPPRPAWVADFVK